MTVEHFPDEGMSMVGADAVEMVILWMLVNSITSNVELARLSNICRHWRRVTAKAILEQARSSIPRPTDAESPSPTTNRNNEKEQPVLLLLPSMVRRLLVIQYQEQEKSVPPVTSSSQGRTASVPQETFCAAWFDPGGIRSTTVSLQDYNQTETTREDPDVLVAADNISAGGLSPHHPSLIHRHTLSLSSEPFGPGGAQIYEKSDNSKDTERRSRRNRSKSPSTLSRAGADSGRGATAHTISSNSVRRSVRLTQQQLLEEDDCVQCALEWRGRRSPFAVLQSFGYARSFVESVLSSCSVGAATTFSSSLLTEDVSNASSISPSKYFQPTFAVRGAALARPENYCLCVDNEENTKNVQDNEQDGQPGPTPAAATATHATNNINRLNDHGYADIRLQEYQQSLLRKYRRRKLLQHEVLPRIICSNPNKNRTVRDDSIDTQKYHRQEDPLRPQESLQFLNADGSHAVYMMTPPFACGPLREPVTIICVGIATEDGCFLSGLQHRFELGHLYPNHWLAHVTELSPICTATVPWRKEPAANEDANDDHLANSGHGIARNQTIAYKFSSDDDCDGVIIVGGGDSSDEDCDTGDDGIFFPGGTRTCDCIFQGMANKLDELDNDGNDPDKNAAVGRRISRGRMGPGQWHCYVAVFDGSRSFIRIDGVEEPTSSEIVTGESNSNGLDSNTPATDRATNRAFRNDYTYRTDQATQLKEGEAMLDGLTIGSDHCFGFSLCCGYGSGGEGEGALSEVVVWKGRLDVADIAVLEKQLMAKHAIPTPPYSAERIEPGARSTGAAVGDTWWQENEWNRQAHALFCQVATHQESNDGDEAEEGLGNSGRGVPLRYLARHRTVAWHQQNAVTGKQIKIPKIGSSRPCGSSSDW